MKRLLNVASLLGRDSRTMKNWLLIGGATFVVALLLGVWGLVAVWGLVTDHLPQWTGQGKHAMETIVEKADGVVPGLREKAEILAPGLTDKVGGLLGRDTLPTQDVGGEDIPDLPRYPGMVRTAYRTVEGRKTVTYQGRSSFAGVVRFYREEMQRGGWMVTVLEGAPDREVHAYARDGRRVAVTLSRAAGGNLTAVVGEER